MKVVFAPTAKLDPRGIVAWICPENPGPAGNFVEAVVDRCQALAELSRRHPLVPRYAPHGIRRFPYRDYLIVYRVIEDAVQIVHVLRGARDYEKLLIPAGKRDRA